MNNIETIDGIKGEWRTVTKPEQVTVGQMVRYTDCEHMESNDIRFICLKSDNVYTLDGKNEHIGTVNLFSWSLVQAFFPLPVKRKVAKVTVSQKYASSLIQICGVINGVKFYNHYKSRKSALLGAQRFCKAIGYEMEVVK